MATTTALLMMAAIAAITLNSGYGFTTIPGRRLKQVTASTNYFWGVDTKDFIYMCKRPCNGNWRRIGGLLMQVDADDYEVWGVNKQNHIYKRPVDGSGNWKQIGGALNHVTASGNGYIWGVNKGGAIYRCAKPCNGAWKSVNGRLRQIDGGLERVYGVTRNNDVFTRPVDGSDRWRQIPGLKLKHITASGAHEVYGITPKKDLYRCMKPCLGEWVKVDGSFEQVDAAIHGVYGVTCANNVMGKLFPLVA